MSVVSEVLRCPKATQRWTITRGLGYRSQRRTPAPVHATVCRASQDVSSMIQAVDIRELLHITSVLVRHSTLMSAALDLARVTYLRPR